MNLLFLNTYTGLSRVDLIQRDRCYPGRFGLYSNVKGSRLTVTLYGCVKDPWYSKVRGTSARYFNGRLREQDGKVVVTGRLAFTHLYTALFLALLWGLLLALLMPGHRFFVESLLFGFLFVMLGRGLLNLFCLFAYRKSERLLIEKLSLLFSPDTTAEEVNITPIPYEKAGG